jgi:hypothetical protein
MKLRTLCALAGLLAVCGAAQAQVTHTMTFDTDALGNPIASGTIISEQYAAWGIHFVPNVLGGANFTGDNYATNTVLDVTDSDFDPAMDPQPQPDGNLLHGYTNYLNEDGDTNFWIKFDKPVTDVSLDVYGGYLGDFALYGMDQNLNLLDFAQPDQLFNQDTMSLGNDPAHPISYLIVTGSNDFGYYDEWTGIDNIQFTVVPEPGSLTLLLSVLGVGAAWRRREQHRRR